MSKHFFDYDDGDFAYTVSDEAFCYGRGLKINIFYDKNLFILAVSMPPTPFRFCSM